MKNFLIIPRRVRVTSFRTTYQGTIRHTLYTRSHYPFSSLFPLSPSLLLSHTFYPPPAAFFFYHLPCLRLCLLLSFLLPCPSSSSSRGKVTFACGIIIITVIIIIPRVLIYIALSEIAGEPRVLFVCLWVPFGREAQYFILPRANNARWGKSSSFRQRLRLENVEKNPGSTNS